MIDLMLEYKNTFLGLEKRLNKLSEFIKNRIPEIEFYQQITIPIKFDSLSRCFDHIVSWSYSLVFESLGKHYEFIVKQANKLKNGYYEEISNFKMCIHFHRTYQQHSLFDIEREKKFKDFVESWFQDVCGHNEPKSNEHWKLCVEKILVNLEAAILCLEETIKQSLNNKEFSEIFINEWIKSSQRNFEKHEYAKVLKTVLSNHSLSNLISPEVFIKKYLSEWQKSVEILPDGFNFETDVAGIIERSILKGEIIPITGSDLIENGIPKGKILGECLAEAKRKFQESPCNATDLLSHVLNWLKEKS